MKRRKWNICHFRMIIFFVGLLNIAISGLSFAQTNLTMGVPYSDSVTSSGEKKYYKIDVAANEQLLILVEKTISWDSSVYIKYGQLPTTSDYDDMNSSSYDQSLEIPSTQSGTYYIMLVSGNPSSNSYTITPRTSLESLTIGAPTSGTLSYYGAKQYYQLSLAAGLQLFVLLEKTISWNSSVYIKYGQLPTTSDYDDMNSSSYDQSVEIANTQSGTYYIMLVSGNPSSNSYTITPRTSLESLTIGSPTSGTLSYYGAKQYYQLSLAAGLQLFVLLEKTISWNSSVYIKYGQLPTTSDYDDMNSSSYDQSLEIPSTQSGTYYIMLVSGNPSSNSYTITPRTSLESLTIGAPTSGTLSYYGAKQYYQLSLAAGLQLFVLLEKTISWNSSVYIKYGQLPTTSDYDDMNSSSYDQSVEIANTQSGTYYIMLVSGNPSSNSYTITPRTSLESLTIGSPTSGTLSYYGAKQYYQLSLAAGLQLFVLLEKTISWNSSVYIKYGQLPTTSDYDDMNSGLYDQSLEIPSTQSGTYYIMLVSGNPSSNSYTITPKTATIDVLIPGESYQGSILSDLYNRYVLETERSRSLLVEIVPQSGINSAIFDGKLGTMPLYAGSGDYTTQDVTPRGKYELLISPTEAGTYYFSLFGQDIGASGGSYTIKASYVDYLYLSNISPRSGGNEGSITIDLKGLNFTQEIQISLTREGFPLIAAAERTVISSTGMYATFDLNGAQPGIYDVRIEKAGGSPSILEDAFEVIGGLPGHFSIVGTPPSAVRPSRNYTFWLEYGNDGGSDLPAPLFIVSNNVNAKMRLSKDEPYKDGPIQVLGVGFDGPAGTLSPGSSYRIPIYFQVPSNSGDIDFTVENMTADTTPIDWATIEKDIRPDDMDDDAWAVIWTNFKAQMGGTWADYLKRLNQDATYISLYRRAKQGSLVAGDLTLQSLTDVCMYDIRTLFGFEFAKASAGMCPRTALAGARDLFVPAPGLPLAFGRFAAQSIENRFKSGLLGRGWSHTYEYRATTDDNGDVTIAAPGGGKRVFTLVGGGAYQGAAGDYGTLTLDAGKPVLREKTGIVWRFGADGKLASIADPNSNKLTLTYTDDDLTTITHSNGQSITLEYNAAGRIIQATDPAGRVVAYQYDAAFEQLVSVVEPGGMTTAYAYHPADGTPSARALTAITFPDGTHYSYDYDSQGRLNREWGDQDAGETSYAYDSQGKVTITDALGNKSYFWSGPKGALLQAQTSLGAVAKTAYDDKTQMSQLVGPDGRSASMAYDTKGNPTGVENALDQVVQMTFEPSLSRMTQLVDTRSNKTQFAYDAAGNLLSITYPDTKAESFGYDAQGLPTTYTSRRGSSIQYSYNERGQVTEKSYPGGKTIQYQYDAKGNLISAEDSETGTIVMQYDDRDFLTRISYPGGYWFAFQYDDAGKRTRRTGHDGHILNYFHDDAGRLQRMTDGAGQELVRYEYNKNNYLTKEIKGNGTYTTYTYDTDSQLLHMVNYSPGGAVQSRFDYTYDVNGNRTAMSTLEGTTSYQYDATGQLVGVTYPGGRHVVYDYDAAGNRVSVTDSGTATSYTTNNMNQYTKVGNATYTYDADGNMISKTDASGTTTYTYDDDNRLIQVNTPSNGTWEYTYDALGNRMTATHDGELIRYVHDPRGLVDVAAQYDTDGALVARYTHGLGLVSRSDESENPAFYAFDAIGNTRQMSDASGAVVNTYDYSPFGISLGSDETVENPFRYVGRFGVMDEGNGLQFMRARYYDGGLGRFITIDPILFNGKDNNLYRYVVNQPLDLADPHGLGSKSTTHFLKWPPHEAIFFDEPQTITLTINGTQVTYKNVENIGFGPWGKSWYKGGISINSEDRDNYYNGFPWGIGNLRDDLLVKTIEKTPVYDIYFPFLIDCRSWANAVYEQYLIIELAESSSQVIKSVDPNEKAGPAGIGEQKYVVGGEKMAYTIYFENKSTATAPAQEVFITDYLDTDLDWTTFRLGEVAFGSQVVNDLTGKEAGETQVMLPDLAVDISAQRYPGSGTVRWTLKSIDPETGELPEDPYAGFLPPEDGSGRGQGHVSFTVKARNDRTAGTTITNTASIVFDTEAPISTNQVSNTIADAAPSAPTNPGVPDGSTDVAVSAVLSWTGCEYATSYEIYLWKSDQPKPATPTANGLSTPYYDPAPDLVGSTTYSWQAVAVNTMGKTSGPVWGFTTRAAASVPTVTTGTASSVTPDAATLNGTVNPNSADTTAVFEWGTDYSYGSTVTSVQSPLSGTGTQAVNVGISGLVQGTTYHFRVKGTNSEGIRYGDDQTFATDGSNPSVTTTKASSITYTSATTGGNVTSDGGSPVTARGVCWRTTENPTTDDNVVQGGAGTGTFSCEITGLSPAGTYYVRAYATNSTGTGYGDNVAFTTTSPSPTAPTVTTSPVSSITTSSAKCGGTVTSEGGAVVTARGVCWSTSANPTTGQSHTTDGTGAGSFASAIEGLKPGMTYHVRAYATNVVETAYGTDRSFTTDFSTILYVNKNDGQCGEKSPCYTSIQDAVDKAIAGAAIRISHGDYDGSFRLERSINLTIQGGWDDKFKTQTANKTFTRAPSAPKGSLTIQMLTVKP